MKSFRTIVSEVAEPKSGDEKAFKDKHITTKKDHPVADDNVFKGGTKKAPKRIADHEAGDDAAVYEAMDPVNKKAAMGKFKNRADKDIDNDGDVDSSDKYLHARRKAITKAIHKEEAEELDEKLKASTDMGTWIKDFEKSDAPQFKGKSKEKRRQMAIAAKYGAEREAGMREETELEESITKMSHGRLKFHMNNKSVPHGSYSWDQMKAERDRRLKTGEGEAYKKAKASMSEDFDQLDEIGDTTAGKKKLKNLIVNRTQKAVDAGASLERRPEKAAEYDRAQKRHMKTIGRAATRLAKEEVEQLDELSPDLKSRYAKKAATSLKRATTYKAKAQDDAAKASKNIDRGYGGDRSVNIGKQYNRLDRADAKVAKHDKTIAKRTAGLKRANEEVEQLDELSPNTLHSYIKKAAGNMAGNAAVAATQASSSMKKSSPDVKRNIRNRMRGITSASGRLADKANMAENAWEEIPMMQRQLQFIAYAAEEISDYLDMGVDPEEWFQNKLAGLHQTMLSMYAYAQGEMQMSGGMYGEEVELDEAAPTKKAITRALQGMKVQPKDKVTLKKAPWEKNESLDEVTQSAIKKPVTTTGPDGKTRTVYKSIKSVDRDEHGQEKIKESVLDEAFKTGIVKLKDGGSVILKKEDADLLNQMFKDLSSTNRKKMQEVAMKDKAGFEEILGFAKEAL